MIVYTTLEILYLWLIFATVVAGIYGVSILFLRPNMAIRRLQSETAGPPDITAAENNDWQAKIVQLVGPLARLALPVDGLEYSAFRLRFMNAGFRSASAPIIFFSAKLVAAMVLPAVFIVCAGFSTHALSANTLLLLALALAALGFFLPNVGLAMATRRRQRELLEAFPDAIDLLVVCVESGLGLDAAIARTSHEMRLRSPLLADELHLMTLELRIGSTRVQALRNLALRTGLDDVSSLVTMLVQADRFGTNVADALRVHADSLRMQRQMRAEEAAAKLPVKLVFPLILCIFPSLMIVLAGPSFLSIFRSLVPVLSGR